MVGCDETAVDDDTQYSQFINLFSVSILPIKSLYATSY